MKLAALFFISTLYCSSNGSDIFHRQTFRGIEILNQKRVSPQEREEKIKCLSGSTFDMILINVYENNTFLLRDSYDSTIISQHKNVIGLTLTPSLFVRSLIDTVKTYLYPEINFLWLNTKYIADNELVINAYISSAASHGVRLGILHDSDNDLTKYKIPIRQFSEQVLLKERIPNCGLSHSGFKQFSYEETKKDDEVIMQSSAVPTGSTDVVEQAVMINFSEEFSVDEFPKMLDCLRGQVSSIFLPVYYDQDVYETMVNAIPQILARNFTLYVVIVPSVFNSTDAYKNILCEIDMILAKYNVQTNFFFYYTFFGGQYIYQTMQAFSYALEASQEVNMRMGAATSAVIWNSSYNNTHIYSNLTLWDTNDGGSFNNFTSYGGWTSSAAVTTGFYSGNCINNLQRFYFYLVNIKPQFMKGLSVSPISDHPTTKACGTSTTSPSITITRTTSTTSPSTSITRTASTISPTTTKTTTVTTESITVATNAFKYSTTPGQVSVTTNSPETTAISTSTVPTTTSLVGTIPLYKTPFIIWLICVFGF